VITPIPLTFTLDQLSKIPLFNESSDLLMFWFGNRSLDLTLGYRLSENGGSIAEFYDKVSQCGDRGSLIVVQSELG
jgi:hypothetical protein